MNRSELIATLSQRFPLLAHQDAELAVTEIIDAVARALVTGRRVAKAKRKKADADEARVCL